ncbi:hypothetical protein BQ8482_40039 [Mesorhizobium delmotii]|uniref:Uncharacterized protein n=1 Tax=Mesorhizobium delmotii TaxID=1631247 RepID=A0A2P9ASW5_9HYPH|nr:hypothetical protein BQ8482_40039 [Mesorhizobium delmotii]
MARGHKGGSMPDRACRHNACVRSGVHAGIDRIDIVEDVVGPAAAHELHRRLAGKPWQRLRAIPGIGHQRRTEARLDLVDDLDHLAQAPLGLVRADPILALDRVLAQSGRASDFLARRPEGFRNPARGENPVIRILGEAHGADSLVSLPVILTQYSVRISVVQ